MHLNYRCNRFGAAGDDSVMVSATSQPDSYSSISGSPSQIFFFASGDSRAEVYTGGFTNQNPYDYRSYDQSKGTTQVGDQAIGIIFNLGSLAAGESTSFVYNTSLTTIEASSQVIEQINATEWSFDPADPAYDFLAVGESLEIPVTYSVTDSFGAVDTESFDISIDGTNDPVTSSGDLVLIANEVGTSSSLGIAQQGHDPSGDGATSLLQNNADLDASDVLRITHIQVGANSPLELIGELTVSGLYGSLRLQPNGAYSYFVDNTLPVVNGLSEEESLDDLFTLKISDLNGNFSICKSDDSSWQSRF